MNASPVRYLSDLPAKRLRRDAVERRVERIQRLCFFRTNRVCLETRRRLHGHKREQLEQMVRYHVAHGAGCIIEAATVAYCQGFRNRDLYMVDVMTIPNWLEQPICEA